MPTPPPEPTDAELRRQEAAQTVAALVHVDRDSGEYVHPSDR